MLRRHFIALMGACLAAPALAADELPVDIVRRIYRLSAGRNNDYSGNSAFFDDGFRRAYFSKSLLAAVVAAEKKSAATGDVGLDFDPVTASQDPVVKGLKIVAGSLGADQADASARFYAQRPNQMLTVRYSFIREGGGWKLDNIAETDRENPWDLRDLLKEL